MARLGVLSPSTRGEGFEGVQALTSDCDPTVPFHLLPQTPNTLPSPAQQGTAGHSHGEQLWPENTKVPAPATSP